MTHTMKTNTKRRRSQHAMKRTVILSLALLALVGAFGVNHAAMAQEPGVGAGATFNFGVDARALAMGGAYVAIADGYSAPYWNAAGLAGTQGTRIGGMNTNKFGQGIQYNYVGATTRLAGFPVGAAFVGSSISGIETFGPGGESTGTVNDNEFLFMGSTAFPLSFDGLQFAIGGSAKYYSHSLAGESGTGFGGDVGLYADAGNFSFGASATDLGGTSVSWTTDAVDEVDMGIRAGGALDLEFPIPWTISGQYDVNAETLRVGAEFRLTEQISLRAGAKQPGGEDFQFSAGAGLALGAFGVDAAFVQNPTLGNSLVVSGQFAF